MADKKLSSVSSVSDAAYVYAETSNGDTVKISKADLASVVAGLIGESSSIRKGLQPSGMGYTSVYKYIETGANIQIDCNGFLLLRVPYSWAGFELWYCSADVAKKMVGTSYSVGLSVTSNGGIVTITNNASAKRGVQLIYQNLPIISA